MIQTPRDAERLPTNPLGIYVNAVEPMTPLAKPCFAATSLCATMLAGCATNRTPRFSYDADVPPLPVVQAPGAPTGRVENANAAARVEPRREGYHNVIQIYPWSEGTLYQVYAAGRQLSVMTLILQARWRAAGQPPGWG